ncbi:MAG TPA: enoyl-CoA hydratase-related protein [Polyangia bacterium]
MTLAGRQYEQIRVEHAGPLSWIVLDRPDRANALSAAMLDEFSDALDTLRADGGPVIGLRGEGKGFSAGMDLDEVGKLDGGPIDPAADRARLQRNVDRWLAMWDHPKPIIAAVHGYCMAVATQLCVFADLTIVTDDARIGEPTLPIGGGFVAPVWASLVGPKRAKELAFVPGNSIDGPTAVQWGFANHSVPADQLLSTVATLAERIALIPSEVLRVKKLSINRAAEAPGFRASLAHLAEMDAQLHKTPAVVALKEWITEVGLKTVMTQYRVPSTASLFESVRAKKE